KLTPARKFLMAGKSGLNITKAEGLAAFAAHYDAGWLAPMLAAFGPDQVQAWCAGLGQAVFTGSSGRVFPTAMKASPLLRAWLRRLGEKGVVLQTGVRWDGTQSADVTVLAMGGGSWARLGSDGAWVERLGKAGVAVAPLQPSNVGISVGWSAHMRPHFGAPLKAIALRAGDVVSRGEVVITATGIEGGGIYPLTPALREGAALTVDLAPDMPLERLAAREAALRRGETASNRLRKLGLSALAAALVMEMARPLPPALAPLIKALPLRHAGLRPVDEAISTAGGITRDALTDGLELRAMPGVFACGEMLDWDAPTGGYLLTACLATGLWAGRHAAERAHA
ncbi:MAG: TIGR03862 family flavoprotein, partial [Paracoccaceae bacterium]